MPRSRGAFAESQLTSTNAEIVIDLDGDRKPFATMTAQAARCGCTLHELSSGGYLLSRWGMSRELPSLRDVGDMLRLIGGDR